MSSYIEGQTHQVMDALEGAGWRKDDLTLLGQAGKDKLNKIRSFLRGDAEIVFAKRIINRAPFDYDIFIGQGWTTWKGPANGNGLEGEEEVDGRSLVLTEVDFTQVRFFHCLTVDEEKVKGEEKLRRMRDSGNILLDSGFGAALLDEPGQATLEWYYETTGKSYLDFPGQVLRAPNGTRCVLCVFRRTDGRRWYFECRSLYCEWGAYDLSASLAK